MAPHLITRGLVGERNGLRLWGPLTWRIEAGQAWHVQGPNGCGKTTLLRTLAGLRPPLAGQLQQPDGGCAWLGHRDGWAEALDAATNLRLHAALHGADTAAVPGLLQALHIPDRPVGQLSAGQRRKLALARLMLAWRPLWLLDEPFDALDADGSAWLCAAVRQQLEAGGAVVLTSHQPLPAGFVAHQVLPLGRRSAMPCAEAA